MTDSSVTHQRKGLPSFVMSAAELADLWGYKNVDVLYSAVHRGSFPIPTYKIGKRLVADTEVVRAFFRVRRNAGLREVKERFQGKDDEDNLRDILS